MPSDIFIHLNDKIANKDNKTVRVVYNTKAKVGFRSLVNTLILCLLPDNFFCIEFLIKQ